MKLKKKKKKAVVIEAEVVKPIKKKSPEIVEGEAEKQLREKRAYRILRKSNRRDLVRECLLRGLPFEKASKSTPYLAGWLTDNLDMNQNPQLLTEYDAWLKDYFKKQGNPDIEALTHPDLRFGLGNESSNWVKGDLKISTKKQEVSTVIAVKKKKDKDEKPTRKKDEVMGVCGGTKKHLVYTLAREGVSLQKVLRKVCKLHPDANEKSVRIWYKRALKPDNES